MVEIGKVNAGYGKFCSTKCYHLSTRKKIKKTCSHCKKEFSVHPSTIKKGGGLFCSKKCYLENKVIESRVEKICQVCGKTFSILRSWVKKGCGKYCSRRCKFESQQKQSLERICQECGQGFMVYPYVSKDPIRGKFCSNKCKYDWMGKNLSGENSPTWRGGISFEPYGLEWTDELREKIRRRDDYQCAICRLPGKIVHHIDYQKENNIATNLVVLCGNCHSSTNFTRSYWQETLKSLLASRLGYAL